MIRTRSLNTNKLCWLVVACLVAAIPSPLYAHASERGFILLLPTHYYLAGGTFAVFASVLLVALLRTPSVTKVKKWRYNLPLPPVSVRDITSLLRAKL